MNLAYVVDIIANIITGPPGWTGSPWDDPPP